MEFLLLFLLLLLSSGIHSSSPLPSEVQSQNLRRAASCKGLQESCGPFSWCCDGMSCDPRGFRCYHSPRREGEPCRHLVYRCEADLTCSDSKCVDSAEILESGNIGQCSQSVSPPETVTVMTYNLYLINFPNALNNVDERISEIVKYFNRRQLEDIVVFQEVFLKYDIVRDGMADAGYCHYVTTKRGHRGSGKAIYSKFPIVDYDFVNFFDFGDTFNPEAIADKGVMYAKMNKDGKPIHVFNTHTMSNLLGEQHEVRLEQYGVMRSFILEKEIPSDELVLMAGDFNENKFKTSFYEAMLDRLDAGEIKVVSDNIVTFDGPGNSLSYTNRQEILDYVFYDNKSLIPLSSSKCEVLKPVDSDGDDLSDHQPVSCVVEFG